MAHATPKQPPPVSACEVPLPPAPTASVATPASTMTPADRPTPPPAPLSTPALDIGELEAAP
eukprot:9383709-Pyramimonas_sp.AAC.1